VRARMDKIHGRTDVLLFNHVNVVLRDRYGLEKSESLYRPDEMRAAIDKCLDDRKGRRGGRKVIAREDNPYTPFNILIKTLYCQFKLYFLHLASS
jgi:hypothetical protein